MRWIGRVRTFMIMTATVALLAGWLSPPAPAAPPSPVTAKAWRVETAGADRWRVSWRADERVRVRDDVPVLIADGRRIGIARPEADGVTFSTLTTDVRVASAQTVTLGWSTDVGASTPKVAPDTSSGWGTDRRGPVLTDDPAATGRYPVSAINYDLGDEAVALPSLEGRSELRGRVWVPTGAKGRRPVVVFLHGMHQYCYDPDNTGGGGGHREGDAPWPCGEGERPVDSYLGYNAFARTLASRGYVVASVSANAVNALGQRQTDLGNPARGELVLATLDLMQRGDRGRGALAVLKGRLDLGHVGLMGHSRGGEGVVRAALQNSRRPHPYGIRGLFLIAPTDFARLTVPHVSTAVVLPYCDADVLDLQGQHFLDDTDLTLRADRSFRSGVMIMGANHNFFNTEWSPGSASGSGYDEWGGPPKGVCGAKHPDRLSAAEQQRVGRAYLAGFFRATVGGERRFLPLFDGSDSRARSAGRAVVRTTFTGPAGSRRTLARLISTVPAGAVSGAARLGICVGQRPVNPHPGEDVDPLPTTDATHPACTSRLLAAQASHWAPSPFVGNPPGTGVGRLTWTGRDGRVTLPLAPGQRDVRAFDALAFKASPDPAGRAPVDLSVVVVDGRGRSVRVPASAVSDALVAMPGRGEPLPRTQLRTVRVPLTRLAGIDLADVRRVELRTDRTDAGSAYVAQIAFTRTAPGVSGPVSLPVLRLAGRPDVAEGASGTTTAARFTAVLSRPSPTPVTVEWSAARDALDEIGPALGESTVVPRRTGRVIIPAGVTRLPVTVPVEGNDRYGSSVTINAGLSAVSGAVLGTNIGYGTVRDDDPPPTLRIGAAQAEEGSPVIRFPITLSAPSDQVASVMVTVQGGTAKRVSDWQVVGDPDNDPIAYGLVPVGATKTWLRVKIIDDAVAEPTETFTVRVDEVGGATRTGPRTVTGTITDDD